MCKLLFCFVLSVVLVAKASSSCNAIDDSCDVQDTSLSLLQASVLQEATIETSETPVQVGNSVIASKPKQQLSAKIPPVPAGPSNTSLLAAGRDYGFGDFKDFVFYDKKKCANTAASLGNKNNAENCRSSCEKYAESNGYTDGFCCQYRKYKSGYKCQMSAEGDTENEVDDNYVVFNYFDNHVYYEVTRQRNRKYLCTLGYSTCNAYDGTCCDASDHQRIFKSYNGYYKLEYAGGGQALTQDECKEACAWAAYEGSLGWTGLFSCSWRKNMNVGECRMTQACTDKYCAIPGNSVYSDGKFWDFSPV